MPMATRCRVPRAYLRISNTPQQFLFTVSCLLLAPSGAAKPGRQRKSANQAGLSEQYAPTTENFLRGFAAQNCARALWALYSSLPQAAGTCFHLSLSLLKARLARQTPVSGAAQSQSSLYALGSGSPMQTTPHHRVILPVFTTGMIGMSCGGTRSNRQWKSDYDFRNHLESCWLRRVRRSHFHSKWMIAATRMAGSTQYLAGSLGNKKEAATSADAQTSGQRRSDL